jgi:glycosyltransferase involved in cell wall biosynthesis
MRIAFVHNGLATFVERDLRILRKKHEVRELHFRGLFSLPKIFVAVLWSDLSFAWFASIHAFWAVLFSKILGRKAVVVSGGYDVACVPEIRYGLCYQWWKRWCPKFVFRLADLILCVSKYNMRETLTNARAPRRKVRMIYHGIETEEWKISEKEYSVVSVGSVDRVSFARKGIDVYASAVSLIQGFDARLVGKVSADIQSRISQLSRGKLEMTGRVSFADLRRAVQKARVYVQPSWHEAFGCSVAEAMLCGCVPVVSRRGALPEVVGDCGFYLDRATPEELAAKIKVALDSNIGIKARQRIVDNFPFERRERDLLSAIKTLNAGVTKHRMSNVERTTFP